MTLLISLANKSFSLLVADRRISQNGVAVDDEFNKLCVLCCNDARVAVAFTGLATLPNFNTSDWITQELADIGKSIGTISEILVELSARATTRFRQLSAIDNRLSILISGYIYWDTAPQPIAYILSNFERGQPPKDYFFLRTIPANNGVLVEFAGNVTALPQETENRLRKLLLSNLEPASVLRSTIKHLRLAAKRKQSNNSIGEQCNSAIIQAQTDTVITATYHSNFKSYAAYSANVVITQGMCVSGTEIFADTVLAGPDIRKNDPCWCGSGVLFKHCHMRKFGAFYIQHNAFKRPMYMVCSMSFDEPRLSGKDFWVASGYS